MAFNLLKDRWILVVCTTFILLNAVLMAFEQYWLNLLPVALILGWAMIARADRVLLFIVFATPLSINMEQLDLGASVWPFPPNRSWCALPCSSC